MASAWRVARGFLCSQGRKDHLGLFSMSGAECQKRSGPGITDGALGLSRTREGFGVRKDEETYSSPRIRADISAALVDTDEN